MPVKLNLLPQALLVSKGLGSVLKTIRALNVILVVAFLVFVVGIGGLFLVSKSKLNSIEKNVDRLKTQIIAQESSEQQLILMKDRLSKISGVRSSRSILDNINNIYSLVSNLSVNSEISELDMDLIKINLSMTMRSNDDLTMFFKNIGNTNIFKTIVLTSFGYNATSGYALGVNFIDK
jgi:hypothetical protein